MQTGPVAATAAQRIEQVRLRPTASRDSYCTRSTHNSHVAYRGDMTETRESSISYVIIVIQ